MIKWKGSKFHSNTKLWSDEFGVFTTNALIQMLKRGQHDKKKHVIPNHALNQVQGLRFRNLEFVNDNRLIALVFVKYSNLRTPN
jgi:hypothetical protein